MSRATRAAIGFPQLISDNLNRNPLIKWTSFIVTVAHDDVIKWKHFPRYWPFVRGIHRSPVNSPHKGQWRGALMLLWSAPWINGWVNNSDTGDLRRHRAHYDVIVMWSEAIMEMENPEIAALGRGRHMRSSGMWTVCCRAKLLKSTSMTANYRSVDVAGPCDSPDGHSAIQHVNGHSCRS